MLPLKVISLFLLIAFASADPIPRGDAFQSQPRPREVCVEEIPFTRIQPALRIGLVLPQETSEAEEQDPSEESLGHPKIFPSCFLCKQVVKYINKEVKDNRTEEAIKDAFRKACNVLGSEIPDCQSKAEDYAERVVFVLKSITDPSMACVMFGACGSSNALIGGSEDLSSESSVSNSEACFECQQVAHFIQVELNNYKKEQEIESWITTKICPKFTVMEDTCKSFVEQYAPSIIQLIAMKVFDPKVLCEQELGICPGITGNSAVNLDYQLNLPSKAGICDSCIQAVEKLDRMLESGSVDQGIAQVVEEACAALRGAKKARCERIIEIYGPYILRLIGRENNPRAVCKTIDLCTLTGETHVLGGHKCTFGPTYWCHTTSHADACNARDYCSRRSTPELEASDDENQEDTMIN